jgi:hypothetical protein
MPCPFVLRISKLVLAVIAVLLLLLRTLLRLCQLLDHVLKHFSLKAHLSISSALVPAFFQRLA